MAGVQFAPHATVDEWLKTQDVVTWKERWLCDGFVVVDDLLDDENTRIYRELCEQLLSGQIDASTHRHDLGSHAPPNPAAAGIDKDVENTTQIMWPSLFFAPSVYDGPLHQRSKAICEILLNAEPAADRSEIAFDFDMVIDKLPYTDTAVPWHQDEAYWKKANLDFADMRAASCWVSLDTATIENGCMWFIPGSHTKPLLHHVTVKDGAHTIEAPEVAASEMSSRAISAPLRPGSCTFHGGRMLHHTRGNSTDTRRRAWITNHRPVCMST
jgi:phytanoyl-CoA hydroxylase